MRPQERGFTLIEIVVVLLVVAILIAMASALTRGVIAGQKRALTATRMQTVDAALVQYVTQQRRLPCPADGRLPSGDDNAGREFGWTPAGCSPEAQQHGVVPWRALGLTEADATDGWDRRLTYRTDPRLAATNRMNMTGCDPGGSAALAGAPDYCSTACISTNVAACTSPSNFLAGHGLNVKNAAATVDLMDPTASPHTGAAYVLISHGESGGGGYLNSGTLGATTASDGAGELQNFATTSYSLGPPRYYYVDDSLNETAAPAHFDDIVSRPSLLAVITKAGLGPRSH